jgi:hypothetical protein
MLHPKGIIDFVGRDSALLAKFPLSAGDLHVTSVPAETAEGDAWILGEGSLRSPEVRRYLAFLGAMLAIFTSIERHFPKINADSSDSKDSVAQQTSVDEMMALASYLYFLDSHGVAGDVLECGCFKGFSSCCLSWVCDYLGRKLIIADSFEGLPPEKGQQYYKPGEFKGGLDEVRANLESLGRPGCVEFVKGFYSESLRGFQRPLMMIWMDVDLYDSAKDVLVHTFSSLDPRGVLFSHELFETRDFADHHLKATLGSAKAIHEFLQERKTDHAASFAVGCLGLVVPGRSGATRFSARGHQQLLDALRKGVRDSSRDASRRRLGTKVRVMANRMQTVPVLGGLVTGARGLLQSIFA